MHSKLTRCTLLKSCSSNYTTVKSAENIGLLYNYYNIYRSSSPHLNLKPATVYNCTTKSQWYAYSIQFDKRQAICSSDKTFICLCRVNTRLQLLWLVVKQKELIIKGHFSSAIVKIPLCVIVTRNKTRMGHTDLNQNEKYILQVQQNVLLGSKNVSHLTVMHISLNDV